MFNSFFISRSIGIHINFKIFWRRKRFFVRPPIFFRRGRMVGGVKGKRKGKKEEKEERELGE